MFEKLENEPRLLAQVDLRPLQGQRLQPTGFADLGAADYMRPDGTRMLLVESAQSVANRLEAVCLDGTGPRIATELEGLPYVLVKLNGATDAETSSLVEAHRINSPYIIGNKAFRAALETATGYKKGGLLDWPRIARYLFSLDPNSLLHGVFMANFEDGRIRLPRALTGFIEAEGVREVSSGGVKNNPLDPSGTVRAVGLDKDVYGNVPYHRTEFTAERIVAYFNFDVALLAGLKLPRPALDLLTALGLYKVRHFLLTGLRLRTACDLGLGGDLEVKAPGGYTIPSEEALLQSVKDSIATCRREELFGDPVVTTIETETVFKDKKATTADTAEQHADDVVEQADEPEE